ncbi:MAG: amidase [Chloroflexi bacterium]|nr:amidase [Chloroflexota bacterium]MBV9132190.1 amidase [Chloroflexota bacterium]
MTDELPSTIAEAAEALRARRISSVELTRALLERARATQDSIGAFQAFTEETALTAAQVADAELAKGPERGPLQGVPLGIKDILATSDAPTTASSKVLDPTWGQRADATSVRKLREAGAVILGKLVLHEYAIGWPDPDTGMRFARNPWDLARSPGGSSSGTGAALAAGAILGGLGTDTGGSIRGPASFCGISGLKATFGRVSKEGCVPLSYSLDHIGPMARTARDCALLLQVIAGFDPLDPTTVRREVPNYADALNGSVRGVRIGVPRAYFFDTPELNAETRAAVEKAIDDLGRAGAVVREVSLPHAAEARIAQRVIMLGEAYAYHQANLQMQPIAYGKNTRRQITQGALFSAADYVQAQRLRSIVKTEVLTAMADLDVLVTPTSLAVASAFEGYDPDSMRRLPSFTSIWNLTGQPALSVCGGFSSQGLPVGLQIVGKPFDEATVLRVGDAYQQLTDWHTRRPAAAREAQPA